MLNGINSNDYDFNWHGYNRDDRLYKRATVGYSGLPGGCDLILFFFFSGADSIIEGAIGPTAKGSPREHAREQNASRSAQLLPPRPLPF